MNDSIYSGRYSMSARRRLSLVVTLLALITFAGRPALAQPDPAVPGLCYATLGHNASSPGALITVDPVTGAGTLVGPTGILGQQGDAGVPALAIKTTGEMYATDVGLSSRLYRIDATTGAATMVATTILSSITAIAFNGLDQLWAVDSTGYLHLVNDTTGTSVVIGQTAVFIKGLAFDPVDGTLWGTDASGGVYTLDVHTGFATFVGNTGLPASPDIHFDSLGNLYASSGGGIANNNLISIDKSTGAGTVIGPIGFVSVSGMASRLDRVVPVALQSYASRAVAGGVEVAWRLIDIEGTISFDVTRSDEDGRAERIDESLIARTGEEYRLVDGTVAPGRTYRYRVVVLEDGGAVTSFETVVTTPTVAASLDQNAPNPFNPTTTIRFSVERTVHVTLLVYDARGRRVASLVDGMTSAGTHEAWWDGTSERGTSVSSGVYFYELMAGPTRLTRRMVLLK